MARVIHVRAIWFVCVFFLTTCLMRWFSVADFLSKCQPGLVWASTTMQWYGSWGYVFVSSWRLWHYVVVLLPTPRFSITGGWWFRNVPHSSLGILRVFQLTPKFQSKSPWKVTKGPKKEGLDRRLQSQHFSDAEVKLQGWKCFSTKLSPFFLQGWVKW